MADLAAQRADTLSGGQQQRVAIARALVQEPDIILADEPIASLDPRNTQIVMDALRRINRHFGITVLCNLHSLDLARASIATGWSAWPPGALVFDGAPDGADRRCRARALRPGGRRRDEWNRRPNRCRRSCRPSSPRRRRRRASDPPNGDSRMLTVASMLGRPAAAPPCRPAPPAAQSWKAKYPGDWCSRSSRRRTPPA